LLLDNSAINVRLMCLLLEDRVVWFNHIALKIGRFSILNIPIKIQLKIFIKNIMHSDFFMDIKTGRQEKHLSSRFSSR